MRTLKLLLAYDGSGFVGWQRQAVGPSVQGAIEEALARVEGKAVAVAGAGRTDAGVHAAGQVASAEVTLVLDAVTLRRALNAMLPPAIRVLAVEEGEPGFHARFSARSKTYEYRILNGPVSNPFSQRYGWHIPFPLDPERMAEAARLLEGTHDFAAFRSTGTDVQTTVRRVLTSSVLCAPAGSSKDTFGLVPAADLAGGKLLIYRVTGTGFLRHMVRAIAGTLVDIGAGRAEVADMRVLLEERRRECAGPTAPACGLCLARVDYDDPSTAS